MSLSHLLRSGIKRRKIRRRRDSFTRSFLLKDVIFHLNSGSRANRRGRHITQAAAPAPSRAQKFQLIGLELTDSHVERTIKKGSFKLSLAPSDNYRLLSRWVLLPREVHRKPSGPLITPPHVAPGSAQREELLLLHQGGA